MSRGNARLLKKEDAPSLNALIKASIHNKFEFELIDSKTGEVKQRATAFNTICDGLWNVMLSGSGNYSYFNAIAFGKGTGTPSHSDIKLFTFLGIKNSWTETVYDHDYLNGIAYVRRAIRLAPEEFADEDISEIGIADAANSSSYHLCSHATLRDMNNNPLVIHKTGTDILNIYATVYLHHPTWNNESGLIFAAGNAREWFYKWCVGIGGGYPGKGCCLESIIVGIGASSHFGQLSGTIILDPANRKISSNVRRYAVNQGNTTASGEPHHGISMIGLGRYLGPVNDYSYIYGAYGLGQADPVMFNLLGSSFPGLNVIGETLGTGDGSTTEFNTKYGFISNVTVYVNGTAVAPNLVVIEENIPIDYDDIGSYFIPIKNDAKGITDPEYTYSDVIYPAQTFSNEKAEPRKSNNGDIYTLSVDLRLKTPESIFYNPFYQYGIDTIKVNTVKHYTYGPGLPYEIYVSNSLSGEWTLLISNQNASDYGISGSNPLEYTITIPSEYKNYKYWRIYNGPEAVPDSMASIRYYSQEYCSVYHPSNVTSNALNKKNIKLLQAPAAGSVITVDYKTKTIPKDENHVLDVSITLQFNETANV